MAAAVPFAIKAGTMIGGSLLGKKLSGASKEQKSAMTGTQQAATTLGQSAGPLMSTGMGFARGGAANLGAASSYYRNILNNRMAARESLAPEMKTALDFYKGASGKASRTLQGGARDYAMAELDRDKVGNLAMMLPTARAQAAEGAANVGSTMLQGGTAFTGQAGNLASNAAYINSGLFDQASKLRDQEGEGGKAWGSILYDAAQQIPWGKGGGGKTTSGNTVYGSGLPS
jgi:hypothetical protein